MSRLDYLRIGHVYETSDALAVQHAALLNKMWEGEVENHGVDHSCRHENVFVSGGRRMHIWECWGPSCNVFFTPNGFLEDNIQRLKLLRIDVRQELASDANFIAIRAQVNPKTRQNVHTFDSRVRTKAGDRDAGGIGFAVGSHKGDNRLSVYRRGDEQPAVELQLRTRQLEVLHQELIALKDLSGKPEGRGIPWTWLEDKAIVYMNEKLEASILKVFGLTTGELVNGTFELSGDRLVAHIKYTVECLMLLAPDMRQVAYMTSIADGMFAVAEAEPSFVDGRIAGD